MLDAAKELGVSVIAYSPLSQGLLAGTAVVHPPPHSVIVSFWTHACMHALVVCNCKRYCACLHACSSWLSTHAHHGCPLGADVGVLMWQVTTQRAATSRQGHARPYSVTAASGVLHPSSHCCGTSGRVRGARHLHRWPSTGSSPRVPSPLSVSHLPQPPSLQASMHPRDPGAWANCKPQGDFDLASRCENSRAGIRSRGSVGMAADS